MQFRGAHWQLKFVLALTLGAGSVSLLKAQPEASAQPLAQLARVETWVESNVPEMMREAQLPGFAIAIVVNGETVYSEGFGARDPKRNLPATPDTLFGIGSVTKSFVAIGIMQLVEEGKISLEDPVSKHVPFTLGSPENPIRIHHLLTHTPGFPNLGTSSILIGRGLGADTGIPMTSAADFYRFVNGATEEVILPPGEHFFYNNSAWRMLGHIIQEKSGLPFHRYLKEKVINPLGMERTTLDTAVLFADSNHLVPHRRGEKGPEPAPFPYPNPEDNLDFSFLAAAGGISSSVNEMTRYVDAQMRLGEFPGGRLASPDAFEKMQSLQIQTGENWFGPIGYGYGLSIAPDFLGYKMVSHGGSIAVSTAHMAFIPQLKIGLVMMGNGGGMAYGQIAESIFALFLGKDPQELPNRQIEARMERLVGTYETYRGLETVKVSERGGLLYVGEEGPGTPLIPEDLEYRSTLFYTLRDGRKAPIEFKFRENGAVDLLIERLVFHKKN